MARQNTITSTEQGKRKRGNPRPKKLEQRICLSFSANDMQILKDRAKLTGEKLATFVRSLVVEQVKGNH
jgi:hypothetical protein